ncbi:MAG TPA: adenosylcobalamin-dependent ribonucleoside-diphosphate reductase [Nitrospirales bacterium]|nr:adenosylcobalamin-dependent ribonucleoside-diphosphate reductase [Nitrospiraceae bacterium]HNP29689.1 adenosylcobalamin-dependent ribonucleoside-diphosphate reductase [Nitrospirales bacterium]
MNPTSLTFNARQVLEARYLRRDEQGRLVETPDELFQRVATSVASAEPLFRNGKDEPSWRDRFYDLLSSLDFLPNSPTLMNAGTSLGQLSACFVIPIPDTMEGIFEALKQTALVQQTGGGTGFSFSSLRPKGDLVHSTGGTASGPVSFMKIFDVATEHIKQGGKRRGANMGVLRVDHPDILEFITVKREETVLANFNISVGVTQEFLEAARNKGTYALIHPVTHKPTDRIPAAPVFDTIVQTAWETGDPGLLFLDAINRANPTPAFGTLDATNPCGEIPLLPNEACILGSINLARHLHINGSDATLNREKLTETVHTALRFLDNLIEINRYPTPGIEQQTRGNRKIGLGVMGFAEMLIRLGIPYNSPEAIETGEQLMRDIAQEAWRASAHLATERGVFPFWKQSVFAQRRETVRHATCTAIAPTGTISIIAGTTPGIEPIFALRTKRFHNLGGEPLLETAPMLEQLWEAEKSEASPANLERQSGPSAETQLRTKTRKRLFQTAWEISPDQHLQIQAAFQRHVDNSVSKTINLPKSATPDAVAQAYWRAWDLGLKGVTVFRDGCKRAQVLEADEDEQDQGFVSPVCHPC